MQEAFTYSNYIVIIMTIFVAYTIFGIAGFGSALIASPVLALYFPVDKIVPLLALLDMCAAIINVSRDGRHADLSELKRLIPFMLLGSLLGACVLLKTNPRILLLALGLFVTCYAIYALSGVKPQRSYTSRAALPFGFIGGIFSALFGSGGFIYALYLSGRITKKEVMRITQTTLIGMSTLTRVVIFTLAGVYFDSGLLLMASILAPAMLVAIVLGRRITLKMSREQFLKLINIVVLLSGVMLIINYFR